MKRYATLALMIFVTASCNKKPTVNADTHADWLRAGKWTISSGTLTCKLPNGKDTMLNYLNFIPKCHLGDYLVFELNDIGYIYAGSSRCNPGEPDSTEFQWNLSNNENALSLYNGFEFTYSIVDSILPFVFDTTQQTPYLVLDTVIGVFDTTTGFTRTTIELDTIWNMKFDSTTLAYNQIDNATITAISASSFTIYYTVYGSYPDSLNHHTNQLIYADPITGSPDTLDYNPIYEPDTFKFSVTYTSS